MHGCWETRGTMSTTVAPGPGSFVDLLAPMAYLFIVTSVSYMSLLRKRPDPKTSIKFNDVGTCIVDSSTENNQMIFKKMWCLLRTTPPFVYTRQTTISVLSLSTIGFALFHLSMLKLLPVETLLALPIVFVLTRVFQMVSESGGNATELDIYPNPMSSSKDDGYKKLVRGNGDNNSSFVENTVKVVRLVLLTSLASAIVLSMFGNVLNLKADVSKNMNISALFFFLFHIVGSAILVLTGAHIRFVVDFARSKLMLTGDYAGQVSRSTVFMYGLLWVAFICWQFAALIELRTKMYAYPVLLLMGIPFISFLQSIVTINGNMSVGMKAFNAITSLMACLSIYVVHTMLCEFDSIECPKFALLDEPKSFLATFWMYGPITITLSMVSLGLGDFTWLK